MTTEAVETAEQVAAVVDAYRARWLIEEFFKALKTGCGFEAGSVRNFV
jgi:IS4 transposase